MRVLYFTRDYTPHDHRFVSALSAAGHEVAYVRLERGRRDLEDRELPDGVEPLAWAGGKKPFDAGSAEELAADLKEVHRRFRPDVIHAGPIQTAAFVAALSGARPLVTMSWGYDLLVDARQSPALSERTRLVMSRSDALVVDCRAAEQAAVRFGMPSQRIVVLPWGVDVTFFSPLEDEARERLRASLGLDGPARGGRSTPFWLLSTRSWEPLYGVDTLVQGFVRAAARDSELRLAMVGHGSLEAVIRGMLEEAHVMDRVIFTGQIGQREMRDLYRACDLYVSASLTDGTSVSMLEALSCGSPVLLSDIPGNLEWVTPGREGWCFTNGDAEALAITMEGAVGHLRGSSEKRHAMRVAARDLAARRANWTENFPRLIEAYRIATGAE